MCVCVCVCVCVRLREIKRSRGDRKTHSTLELMCSWNFSNVSLFYNKQIEKRIFVVESVYQMII